MTIEAEINGWSRNGQLDGLLQITVCDRLSHDVLRTAAQPRLVSAPRQHSIPRGTRMLFTQSRTA